MKVLLTTIGRRGYLADYFRGAGADSVFATTDRASLDRGFSVGALSADKTFLVPSIRSNDYVERILELCRNQSIELLTSLYDLDTYALSAHLDDFRARSVYPGVSSRSVNEICLSKTASEGFLKNNDFLSPGARRLGDIDAGGRAEFPLIAKPDTGDAGLDQWIIEDAEQLALLKQSRPDLVAQRQLKHPEFGLDIFNDEAGCAISVVVKRKIVMRSGETDQAITVKDDSLLEFGIRLGETLGHTGPLDVDLILTPEGPVVLDMNPRFGGGYPLSHAAGADFPGWMLAMARGEALASHLGNYTEGLVMLKNVYPTFMDQSDLENRFI